MVFWAPSLTPRQTAAVLCGLLLIADACDGAESRDGVGFNREDTARGKQLAYRLSLTQEEAKEGRRMLAKYHAQLAPWLLQEMGL